VRTNIVIDDKLMRDTLRATGLKTKREVVELALQRCRSKATMQLCGNLQTVCRWRRGALRAGMGCDMMIGVFNPTAAKSRG
jgi:Arc/MetJ family transcription regulator